jgi:prolipoprotein diacylglyceryltransferase/protein-S-isoprenylcysteine O-methyltransferase Ste14
MAGLNIPPTLGKVLYALLFNAVLPLLLLAWAHGVEGWVVLPVPPYPAVGVGLVVLGLAWMAFSMAVLRRDGGGLPMNAYPPPNLATRGPYAVMAHPIYVGAVVVSLGTSIWQQHAGGVWLITPALALGCVALVWGYERHDLEARFGPLPPAWLGPVAAGEGAPTARQRLSVWFNVFVPWVFFYESLVALGPAPDAVALELPGERGWPVWSWAELPYASAYLMAAASPWLARTASQLRAFQQRGWAAMLVVFPLHLTLPVAAWPRPITDVGPLAALLASERAYDTPAAAFPSFHAVWAILTAALLALRVGRAPAVAWAGLVLLSCVATGMHTVADVAAGLLVGVVLLRHKETYAGVLRLTQWVANSWQEWRLGPLRVINHGLYAGLGTAATVWMTLVLLGPTHRYAILFACLCGLVVAALWAQVIEGASGLMRPYGFYGGVLGIMVGALCAPWWGSNGWQVLAAYAVGAPVVQAFGRLRCLVQGCCHGSPTRASLGIRYHHPRSRVVRLAHLGDVPVHPTPLYSILWNIPVFLCTARLWGLGVPLPAVCGVYLVLTGLGRFVEEALRGEPQTPIHAGLRLYQWVALLTVVVGAVFTTLPGPTASPALHLDVGALGWALVAGGVVGAALGVDVPQSNARFSRLA